ncbi:MAG: hypothetical protein E7396_06310 [Ruminococcaceae bacterium]|nr:hypothetical protein [Oscillospiraceae bacterium]
MKKALSFILVLCMVASMFTFNVFAAEEIKVTIDGKAQAYDVMPIIENGRTLVPMRGIFEALGAEITWDDATKTVTGKKADISVSLQIGNTSAKVNEKEVTLDVPAKILEGRTLVPVRFISETLGCKVEWEDATKTVIINSSDNKNMATLKSTFHRPVPTEFEKSNDMNDLWFFTDNTTIEDQEAIYAEIKSKGEVVCTSDEFFGGFEKFDSNYGNFEIVDVEGQEFDKALKISCTTVPNKSSDFIIKTKATPERNPGDGVDGKDIMLLAFRFRLTEGGDSKNQGVVQVQIEETVTGQWTKALFKKAYANKDWSVVYMPFTGVDDATSIGIRPGFCEQVIELGGVEIINFGPDFDINSLPEQDNIVYPELEPDAAWRKDAFDRIEKLRKGDFSVVVKDKDGNVIPNAEVEFDMFEHEFEFGCAAQSNITSSENYRANFSKEFNSVVIEHQMNWAPWELEPEIAIARVDAAKELGMKNFRGHNLVWQRGVGSDGKTWLTPEYMYTEEVKTNRALFDEKVKAHIFDIAGHFKGQMDDWDVINEIYGCTLMQDVYGKDMYKDWFKWAREAAGEDCDLYYNEATGPHFSPEFLKILDELTELGVDFDGIGLQSHCEETKQPSEFMALYDSLEKYGKKLKTTEYSINVDSEVLQGNYTRDLMITMFAEEDMYGFLMWGFWDGNVYGGNSPMYYKDWTLKPAGKVYEDLVYNKWWTRDAKATTDAEGKATVRGFYGDYDVTVTANGKTQTVSCAYHKGYDNVLEIVVE